MPRRVALGALALSAAVMACNATVLEVSKDHPAHPEAPVAAPPPTSRVLAADFDALEYGAAKTSGHAHHGHHGHHGGAPAEPAPGDAGATGHEGHSDHGGAR